MKISRNLKKIKGAATKKMEDEQNLQDDDDIQSTMSDVLSTASSPKKKKFPSDAPVTSAPIGTAFGKIQYSNEERNFLQNTLEAKLTNDYIATRPGPGGQPVHYIETWRAIELANHTFGFNGWSSRVVEVTQDYLDPVTQGRWDCGVSAVVQIQLKDGTFHEDIGYGTSENQKQKGAAIEQAKKKAVSDALKRALRNFGNALGLTVYDREHLVKIKKQKKSANVQVTNRPTNPLFGDVSQQQQQQPAITSSSAVVLLKEEDQSTPVNIVQHSSLPQTQQQSVLMTPKPTPAPSILPNQQQQQARPPVMNPQMQRNGVATQPNTMSQTKQMNNGVPIMNGTQNTNNGIKLNNNTNGMAMNNGTVQRPLPNNNMIVNNRPLQPRGPITPNNLNGVGMKRTATEMATSTGPMNSNSGSVVLLSDTNDDSLAPDAKKLKAM